MLKKVLLEAIEVGAQIITHYFNKQLKIENKEGINNWVTEADHASESAIITTIHKHFPHHSILGEETGLQEKKSEYKWIIDPIDGTVNFAHGVPICCVSIAIEKNGELIMGSVYNPLMNEWYFAEKDKGAFLNDKPIEVSTNSNVSAAFLVTGFPYQYIQEENGPLQVFARLIKKAVPVRRLGSAAMDLCLSLIHI